MRLKISSEAFQKLHSVSTASLTSELLNLGFRNTFLKGVYPLHPEKQLVGYAFTLRYIPAREDLDLEVDYDNDTNPQRIAVEGIEENEVMVIDARGEIGAASLGHILCTRMMVKGVAGLLTDGALRDYHSIKELDFPTYAQAAHGTTSSVLHHPVDFQVPIACGGVMVRPGDLIVGDAEGVVVIPIHVAEEVANKCYDRDRLEEWIQKKVANGASIKDVYPPNEETKKEYLEWMQGQRK